MTAIELRDRSPRRLLDFAVVALCMTAALLLVLLREAGGKAGSGRFDAELWRATSEAPYDDRTRLRMVGDLRASGRLIGLSAPAAISLLGEPSTQEESGGTRTMTWRLGPAGGLFPIDFAWLRLWFGRDGRVTWHDVFDS